jgi:hypothetical protein
MAGPSGSPTGPKPRWPPTRCPPVTTWVRAKAAGIRLAAVKLLAPAVGSNRWTFSA